MLKYIILFLPLLIIGCYKKEFKQCANTLNMCKTTLDLSISELDKCTSNLAISKERANEGWSIAIENAQLARTCCINFCDNNKKKADEALKTITYRGNEVSCDAFER